MNIYEGNIIINKENYKKMEKLLNLYDGILGDLSIYSNVKLNALTSVGGDLSIYSNVKLNALTSVGGYLSIYSNVKLNANALTLIKNYEL